MQRTIEAIEKHLSAIRSPLYEIGVFFPAAEAGKDSKMLLRTWDEATVLKSAPWLRAKNAEGAAIYVRPRGEHRYSLVDDLTAEAVQRMKAEGFAPTIVLETSPRNFQAWLNHGEVLDKRTSTAAARVLADRFGGDRGAADWRHFGRLAGFTNRKLIHELENGFFPFVQIREIELGVYAAALDHLAHTRQLAVFESAARWSNITSNLTLSRCIDDFRSDPRFRGDGNRVDLTFSLFALARRASEDSVREAFFQSKGPLKEGRGSGSVGVR